MAPVMVSDIIRDPWYTRYTLIYGVEFASDVMKATTNFDCQYWLQNVTVGKVSEQPRHTRNMTDIRYNTCYGW
jgi:hypothetical protein